MQVYQAVEDNRAVEQVEETQERIYTVSAVVNASPIDVNDVAVVDDACDV